MEKNKQFRCLILLGLLIFGFVFYWYEYRPSKIRKDCWVKIKENIKGKDIDTIEVQRILNICLIGNGLK